MLLILLSLYSEVLISLESQTVILGEEAHFFCQVRGENPVLRINGIYYSPVTPPQPKDPFDVNFDSHIIRGMDEFTDFNISVTITASAKYNETVLECQDQTSAKSTATLIIKGTS